MSTLSGRWHERRAGVMDAAGSTAIARSSGDVISLRERPAASKVVVRNVVRTVPDGISVDVPYPGRVNPEPRNSTPMSTKKMSLEWDRAARLAQLGSTCAGTVAALVGASGRIFQVSGGVVVPSPRA